MSLNINELHTYNINLDNASLVPASNTIIESKIRKVDRSKLVSYTNFTSA